jgi:glycosyltransferase involved in cell wall biosynthesis
MKLLFFASDYQIGLSSLLTQQAIALEKGQLHPVCIAGEKEQEPGLSGQMLDHQVDLIRIKGLDEHSRLKELSNEIGAIIRKNQINRVHVQNNWQLMLVSFYKYKHILPKPFKIIYTLHGFRHNDSIQSVIATMIIGCMLWLFADKIIVMSDYVKKHFCLLSYKIHKLYLGIDDTYFEKAKNEIKTDKLQLIFPAQFRAGKNQLMMIEAIAAYIDQTGDQTIEIYLPGTGVFLDKCKQAVKEGGLEKNVFFPGQCTKLQVKDLYEQCNIGVVSSNTETFGQSIVEPFVLGRPVLTRKVGVAPDIIREGVNGFFFNNAKDLTDKLIYLSKHKQLIQSMGDTNFSQRGVFAWKIITTCYKILLQ